ncbi:MAG: hypothetical protein WEA61_00020 [Anaerolineales bacterium]
MQRHSLAWHLGLALSLFVVAFVLFTVFSQLPHPEKVSPYLYILAAVLTLRPLIRLRGKRGFWGYLLIFLLCLFGFLEEISYGMELGLYEPFTIGTQDLLFQDFHNFIHIFWRWIVQQLGLGLWNSELFQQFLVIDVAILVLGVAFVTLLRNSSARINESQWKKRVVHHALVASAAVSFLSFVGLMVLPADPKNAVFLGFSPLRVTQLGVLGLILLAELTALIYWRSGLRRNSFVKSVGTLLQSRRRSFFLSLLLYFLLAAGIVFEILLSFNSVAETVVLIERITPILGWVIAHCALLLLALACWHGHLRQTMAEYGQRGLAFLSAHPSLIYVVFAALLILLAQALDRDYFFLPNTSDSNTGILARDWHVWTEELFEMIAALQLVAASFFFPVEENKTVLR